MRVRIGGKYWNLRFTFLKENRGDVDAPTLRNKEIRISENLEGEEELEVVIHELLHSADWYKDEEWVERTACEISHILWRLGWRKPPTEKN